MESAGKRFPACGSGLTAYSGACNILAIVFLNTRIFIAYIDIFTNILPHFSRCGAQSITCGTCPGLRSAGFKLQRRQCKAWGLPSAAQPLRHRPGTLAAHFPRVCRLHPSHRACLHGVHHTRQSRPHFACQRLDLRFVDQLQYRIGIHEFHMHLALGILPHHDIAR